MKMSMPDLNWSSVEIRARSGASCTVRSRGRHDRHPWAASPFFTDRVEAQRVFALASNSAASRLPPKSWISPGRRCARPTCHGLGMPTHNPEAVRQRAVVAAKHSG
jgi:hypothetical protein